MSLGVSICSLETRGKAEEIEVDDFALIYCGMVAINGVLLGTIFELKFFVGGLGLSCGFAR